MWLNMWARSCQNLRSRTLMDQLLIKHAKGLVLFSSRCLKENSLWSLVLITLSSSKKSNSLLRKVNQNSLTDIFKLLQMVLRFTCSVMVTIIRLKWESLISSFIQIIWRMANQINSWTGLILHLLSLKFLSKSTDPLIKMRKPNFKNHSKIFPNLHLSTTQI